MFLFRAIRALFATAHRDDPRYVGWIPTFFASSFVLLPVLIALHRTIYQVLFHTMPIEPHLSGRRDVIGALRVYSPKLALFLPFFFAIYLSPVARSAQAKFDAQYANSLSSNLYFWRINVCFAVILTLVPPLFLSEPLLSSIASLFSIIFWSLVLKWQLSRNAA